MFAQNKDSKQNTIQSKNIYQSSKPNPKTKFLNLAPFLLIFCYLGAILGLFFNRNIDICEAVFLVFLITIITQIIEINKSDIDPKTKRKNENKEISDNSYSDKETQNDHKIKQEKVESLNSFKKQQINNNDNLSNSKPNVVDNNTYNDFFSDDDADLNSRNDNECSNSNHNNILYENENENNYEKSANNDNYDDLNENENNYEENANNDNYDDSNENENNYEKSANNDNFDDLNENENENNYEENTNNDNYDYINDNQTLPNNSTNKKVSSRKFKPKIIQIEEEPTKPDYKNSIEEYEKEDRLFISNHPEAKPLDQNEIEFKFSPDFKLDECQLFINDENASIGEIKALIIDRIYEATNAMYSPRRIILTYKGIEIENEKAIKDIKYEKGSIIEISLKNGIYLVKNDEGNIIKIELDNQHSTVADLENKANLKKGFKLKLRNEFLKSEQKLDDIQISKNEIIEMKSIKTSTSTSSTSHLNEKIKFVLFNEIENKNIEYLLNFSDKKNLQNYKKELEIDNDYVFISQGKIINDDDHLINNNNNNQTVYIYNLNNDSFDEDSFNKSARCVKRAEKPLVKVDKITVLCLDNNDKDDPYEGQIIFEYNDIKTVFELRKKVAYKLGFKKEIEIELISLFTPYQTKDSLDFALLNDNEDIDQILFENNGKSLYYKILKANSENKIRPALLKRIRKYTIEQNLKMSDDEIIDIYKKNGDNIFNTFATISYISDKKE